MSIKSQRNEYESFQLLIDAFDRGASACRELALTRPDQSKIWEKMGEALEYSRNIAWQVAGEGTVGKHNN